MLVDLVHTCCTDSICATCIYHVRLWFLLYLWYQVGSHQLKDSVILSGLSFAKVYSSDKFSGDLFSILRLHLCHQISVHKWLSLYIVYAICAKARYNIAHFTCLVHANTTGDRIYSMVYIRSYINLYVAQIQSVQHQLLHMSKSKWHSIS